MRRLVVVLVLAATALPAPQAAAKGFATVALVGADGRSTTLPITSEESDALFGGLVAAAPSGGYVRVYPLARGGFVGAPGRFYPRTGAVCFDWNQARAPRDCRRSLVALGRAARPLARFHGRGTTIETLRSAHVRPTLLPNLDAAFELAFDRWRLGRRAARPARCIPFRAVWRGPDARRRPERFCLSPRGAFAGARLYPLGPDPFLLAAPIRPR